MNALILRPDHIGDTLMTTPFLSVLRRARPGWNISVLCGSWSLPVLENNPNIDDVIVCNFPWLSRGAKASWKTFLSTLVGLRSRSFDVVYNLRKASKTAGVARAVKGRQTWGFDLPKCAWAHSHKIPYRTDVHIADLYVEFAAAQGIKPEHNGLELFFTEQEKIDFEREWTLPERFAVLAPATPDRKRVWIGERWARVADWIVRDLATAVIFIGTADDGAVISPILDSMKEKAVSTAGKMTVRQAALIVKNAAFVVSVNSAPVHISSAVGTPVVGLYGPNNPEHWGPYPNGRANQAVSRVTEFTRGRGSHNRAGGMELISVEDVKKAVRALCEAEHINSAS